MPNTKFKEKHSKHLCPHHPALSSLDTEIYQPHFLKNYRYNLNLSYYFLHQLPPSLVITMILNLLFITPMHILLLLLFKYITISNKWHCLTQFQTWNNYQYIYHCVTYFFPNPQQIFEVYPC